MKAGWVAMMVFIFILLHLSLIPLGNEAFNAEARQHLNNVAFFGLVQQDTSESGIVAFIKAPVAYLGSLYWLTTSGYNTNPIFSGSYQIIGWILLGPIIAAWAFGLIIAFFGIFRYLT